jgi:hypothetical protein
LTEADNAANVEGLGEAMSTHRRHLLEDAWHTVPTTLQHQTHSDNGASFLQIVQIRLAEEGQMMCMMMIKY